MFAYASKWNVVLCLAVILCAALTSVTPGLFVAILIPLSFLFFVFYRTPQWIASEPQNPDRSPSCTCFPSASS
jgi:hypothetical protein